MDNNFENSHFEDEKAVSSIKSGNTETGLLKFIFNMALAGVLTACAGGNEALRSQELQHKMEDMEKDLKFCEDKSLEENGAPVIVSYGTFGLKALKPDRENRFHVAASFSGQVEQTMMIWPPISDPDQIKVEGAVENTVKVPLGPFWGVFYRSTVEKPKETLVIDTGSERFVIFITRR